MPLILFKILQRSTNLVFLTPKCHPSSRIRRVKILAFGYFSPDYWFTTIYVCAHCPAMYGTHVWELNISYVHMPMFIGHNFKTNC